MFPETLRWDDPLTQRLLFSALALVVIYGLVWIGAHVTGRTIRDLRWRHKSRKLLYYTGTVLFLLVLVSIWSGRGTQLALTVTALGAVLAFALQQPVVSLAGWLLIMIKRPYDVGDRIELQGAAGDVIDIQLFKTVLLEIYPEGRGFGSQSTGRVVDVPNSAVFSSQLVNFTRGFSYLWNELPILVTFESDWQKAAAALLEILQRHTAIYEGPAREQIERMARRYMIKYDNLTPTVFVMIRDSGVELGLRYLTPARGRRLVRDAICRDILELFAREPDLEFAYPTYRIFRRELEETKLQARAAAPAPTEP